MKTMLSTYTTWTYLKVLGTCAQAGTAARWARAMAAAAGRAATAVATARASAAARRPAPACHPCRGAAPALPAYLTLRNPLSLATLLVRLAARLAAPTCCCRCGVPWSLFRADRAHAQTSACDAPASESDCLRLEAERFGESLQGLLPEASPQWVQKRQQGSKKVQACRGAGHVLDI